ncbi:MAG: hypothetical protein H6697_10025 [Myxococcales bacterium]|nr:hypothetical protein [Myxococcales bacterium]
MEEPSSLPGLIEVPEGVSALRVEPGALLACERASELADRAYYLMRRRGVVEVVAWNGVDLRAGDGERFIFTPSVHEIVGRVREVRYAPSP